MNRFISYSLPCLVCVVAAAFTLSLNQALAERIFYESFENPNDPSGSSDPVGWTAPGHPGYFRIANETGQAWSTPYGEQGISTYSNGVATKTLTYLDTEPGVYTLTFNISSSASIGEYKAELWVKHPFFPNDILVGSTIGDTDGSKDMSFTDSIVWTLDPSYAGAELEVRLGQDPNRGNWRNTPVWDNVELDFTPDNDTSPPTLTDITDDRVGGSVAPGSPVTYTVRFSEDINASTISTADFYNQAGAPVTIDSVTETAPTSGVFTVQVTPTGGGTLRLGIQQTSVIEDIEGNELDTSFLLDITDDTTIFVEGTLPILAPIDIADDKNGVPIAVNTLVTYTLNFSKDMDASTVAAADFGNAGTATVTIGSVPETSPTSGVFTVQVTPTTGGTLQFRVNASADLQDTDSNALDTGSAIEDDTTITVDNTAPTLASADIIDADNEGNPVAANTTVQFTVIFSEDIDASTVTTADFGNAGSSTISISDISEPSAGVFTVDVTPTSVGTLQLRVNASAIITDALGNNLNTTSAILDDTTITVNGTISNPYETWSEGETFADDTNEDGISNGMAWALGAATVNTVAADLLPTYDYTTDPAYVICTFRRADEANDHSDTTMIVQYGTTLASAGWTTAVHDGSDVIITETNNHYSTSPGIDRVVVKLKRSTLGAGGKLFARLLVEQAP